jgi:hypothetical protein
LAGWKAETTNKYSNKKGLPDFQIPQAFGNFYQT